MVSLQPIDESNCEAVLALRVSPAQEKFVSGVADSLLEAAEEPDGRALYWTVYADETPVGFVMISDDVGSPEYIAHYLWKLLNDTSTYETKGERVWPGRPTGTRRPSPSSEPTKARWAAPSKVTRCSSCTIVEPRAESSE